MDEKPRALFLSAVPCEDEMKASVDGATSLSRVFFIVSPDRLPYRQRLTVFAAWWFQTPDQARLSVRLFSPSHELLLDLAEDVRVDAPALHAQVAGFGWVEFHEVGTHRIEFLAGDEMAGAVPLFVSQPPATEVSS